jgi:predicted Kef-type K+ transport protein
MAAIWIAGALLLGLAAWRIGLPPLVGFLASGFLFGALGMEPTAMLTELAHAGVLLLLFAVGLKLRVKTLLRTEVWGTAVLHLVVTGAAGRSRAGCSRGCSISAATASCSCSTAPRSRSAAARASPISA